MKAEKTTAAAIVDFVFVRIPHPPCMRFLKPQSGAAIFHASGQTAIFALKWFGD
jgi:hypothetical protein